MRIRLSLPGAMRLRDTKVIQILGLGLGWLPTFLLQRRCPISKIFWEFIAADSPGAADRQIDQLFAAFEKLARWSGKGHTRRDLTDRPVRFGELGRT